MVNKLLITKSTSPEEITKIIFKLREQKGKEKEVLKVIDEALGFGHDFVVNLLFEEALTHQHLYMNDNSNKKALLDMQKSVLKAGFYINKYNIIKWQSRYFRFLGRIEDYKKNFKKSILFYKKAIKFVKNDMEPFRLLELEAFLSYSLIMSGKYQEGYKLGKKLYKQFLTSSVGKDLKNKNYLTWFIWLSGLVIRNTDAFLDKKISLNRIEVNEWLEFLDKELEESKENFDYRKKELNDLKEKLKLN